MRSGLQGISENIRVISVIGRFLEHPRIWYFENGGAPRYFIGSADWMSRNLNQRVEAVTPIEDERLQLHIRGVLETLVNDRWQAWEQMSDGRYRQRRPPRSDANHTPTFGTHDTLMEEIMQATMKV